MINSYIALDLETTGLNPKKDRIIEIGAAKIIDGKIVDKFDTLVNAEIKLEPTVTKITGITQEMMEDGMDSKQAVKELVEFCEEYTLLGHNIQFDFSFVKRNAVNMGFSFEKMGIDTLKLARRFLPELEKRSLEYLCEYYKIDHINAHRAYCDALATKELYDILTDSFYNVDAKAFDSYKLIYQVKKEGPITPRQKIHLNDLIKYHKIGLSVNIDSLTKNEASRMIDKIILENGKIIK